MALSVDNALPSPNAVCAFDKTPGSKERRQSEQVVSSPSTTRESSCSPAQRGFVR
ncbi:hypothetical protein MTO96_044582, partial [Rhipicephalus appendiculatus]